METIEQAWTSYSAVALPEQDESPLDETDLKMAFLSGIHWNITRVTAALRTENPLRTLREMADAMHAEALQHIAECSATDHGGVGHA